MTTSVTIKNNGPGRVNINQVEPVSPIIKGEERTVANQTLEVGAETTVHVWGHRHYVCVLETDEG